MCPSKVADGDERGWIVPIGGAEEKEDDPAILLARADRALYEAKQNGRDRACAFSGWA